jgi:hypothetical protein
MTSGSALPEPAPAPSPIPRPASIRPVSPPGAEPLDATLEVHLGDAQGCSGSSPGYVWAAESATSLDGIDPLHGGGPELKVFSAVPVSLIAP